MDEQAEILKIVKDEFDRLQRRNPHYSLRAFSRKLGVPVSALSEVMRGNHKFTRRMAEKILASLAVSPELTKKLVLPLKNRNVPKKENNVVHFDSLYQQIDPDQFCLISEWYHFPILSLAETRGFCDDPKWVAERLNISYEEASSALLRLERLELMVRNENGTLGPTGKKFRTTTGIKDLTLRKHHIQTLKLARESAEHDEMEECNFSSSTMAIDPKRIKEAGEMITHFRRSLAAFLESGEKTEVYRVAVQLFPLTQKIHSSNEMIEKTERLA